VGELVAGGAATPGEVVVLMRATTDIQLYDRALAEAGLPTYVIGGRGYWEQQQVIQLICYLRALANPLDQEAWQTTLLSPLCGLSLDGIVMLAAGAGDQLAAGDRARLDRFESWFAQERAVAARLGPELLLEQALERSGYEIAVVSLPDGRRRLANVRKLMRLARDWEKAHGADLQGFLRLIRTRATADGVRESEAPVEGESLDAVRLMTIHRSKGLEFPVVCVADLGRQKANTGGGLIRIGRDGLRLGLQIRRPGGGGRVNALCYDELREEQRELEDAEERRLFYVAMTRARDRLIVSGAATFNGWDDGNRAAPIGWVGAAFVPDIGARAQAGAETFITDLGVRVSLVSSVPFPDSPKLRAAPASSQTPGPSGPAEPPAPASSQTPGPSEPAEPPEPARLPQQLSLDLQLAPQTESAGRPGPPQPEPAARPGPAPRLSTLSYTSLSTYERCGYRFYIEHVLRFPAACALAPAPAAARGTEIHAILAQLDLRGPKIPPQTPPDVQRLISRFLASSSFRRLAALPDPRREQQFAFGFKDILITGTFDLLARDPRGGALVVDYKSDHLGDREPAAVAAQDYGLQRTVYALAALRIGAGTVEVLHLFLERPQEPAVATYTASDRPALEAELAQHVAGPLAGDFAVTGTPGRRTCSGCPARGGLCSWPLAETER
jgi:ATP-dependent exoDNAse (exonuclease V) beta subunit